VPGRRRGSRGRSAGGGVGGALVTIVAFAVRIAGILAIVVIVPGARRRSGRVAVVSHGELR
jgi:hypothetical protein